MKRNRERVTFFTRISDKLESWMHRQVSSATHLSRGHHLLEIGAGTLNHLKYEPTDVVYDVVEPTIEMYDDKIHHDRIRSFYTDIQQISDSVRYDRIVSIAALEHMIDLPRNVAKAALLLNQGGVFRAGIPSEGGFLWWLSWRLIAVDLFMRTGHNWAEHMRNEHVNSAPEILTVVDHFFEYVTFRRFPIPTHHLSFYLAIDAQQPRHERCRDYLAQWQDRGS